MIVHCLQDEVELAIIEVDNKPEKVSNNYAICKVKGGEQGSYQ